MKDNAARNLALVRFVLLPTLFLTVALLGGLRIGASSRAFVFVAPPLVTLVLAVLLMLLFVRGRLLELGKWLDQNYPALVNVSHALTLLALFFANAQAFNSVLPESGLLHWLFSFFFLWTLWNNLFSFFDARRLLRGLAVLFGTAFVLKHMLLASLYAPEGGWLRRVAGALLEGVSLSSPGAESFAPATGYISFFTLALYVAGLFMLAPARDEKHEEDAERSAVLRVVRAYRRLPAGERMVVQQTIQEEAAAEDSSRLIEAKAEAIDAEELSEETIVSKRSE